MKKAMTTTSRLATGALAALMAASIAPAAAVAGTTSGSGASSMAVDGPAAAATWSVTIPDTVALTPASGTEAGEPGTYTGTANVTYQGEMGTSQVLTITPDPTFTLKDASGVSDDVTATAKVATDGALTNLDYAAVRKSGNANVNLSADLDAGRWSGTENFSINIAKAPVYAATFSDGNKLTWDELKLDSNGTKYSYTASAISDTSIGDYAFNKCTSLTSITIPDSVTSIGAYVFGDEMVSGNQLASVTIPDSVTSIGESAFGYCSKLTSVTIPDSVTSIGGWAFLYCSSLTSVAIPDSVTSIGQDAFEYTGLTSVAIPDSVTSIGDDTFNGCYSLTSVAIPDSVTSIGDYAFNECTSLTSVAIPDSIKSIGEGCFGLCNKLALINYGGTKSQWTAITFESNWNSGILATAVHCTDGDVALS